MKNADDEVKRYADLAEKDYVTKEHYDQLVVNAKVLRATVKADEAAVEMHDSNSNTAPSGPQSTGGRGA